MSAIEKTSVSLTITGSLVSMKNRRRIVVNRRTGHTASIKSEDALRYLADFVAQVPPRYRNLKLGGLSTPLRVVTTVFYSTMRPDLDTALLWDCLQAAGVISNDRYIVERRERRLIDVQNPRVEIFIEETTYEAVASAY